MKSRDHLKSVIAIVFFVLLTNVAPLEMTDPTETSINWNFTVQLTVHSTTTIPSAIPPVIGSPQNDLELSDKIEPSLPYSTMLSWPESWRHEVQGYLNASGIVDPDRRFIIGNQMFYCPAVQLCYISFNPPTLPSNVVKPCCGHTICSCTVDCIDKGTCCPDFATKLITDNVTLNTCILPQFRKFIPGSKNNERSYFMRSECFENFKNETIINLCLNIEEYPKTRKSFLSHVPVTSNATDIIYRNIYCALCNNEDEDHLFVWKTGVTCDKKVYIFPRSFISLLQFILKEKLCNIFYYLPSGLVYPKRCDWGGITKCNHTGEMTSYDPVLEVGCKSYTSLYNGYYRNVHCFMCNHPGIPPMSDCNDGKTLPTDIAAFSALLNFNVFNDEEHVNDQRIHKAHVRSCLSEEIFDEYKNVCRPIKCSDGFVYFNNTCKRIYTEEYLKSYEIYLRSNFDKTDCLNITCVFLDIENFIKRKLPYTSERLLCAVNVILDREDLYCNDSSFRDSAESTAVIIHIELTSVTVHTVQTFVTDMLNLQNEPVVITNTTCRNIKQQELYLRTDSYKYCENESFGTLNRKYINPVTSQSLPFRSLLFPETFMCKSPLRLIRVMNNIACPQISLQKSEYNFTFVNGDICIRDTDECFQSGYYTNDTNTIIVCKDDYLSRISNLMSLNTSTTQNLKCPSSINYLLNMVTFICLILSVVSLVITFVIYCCFRELRTLPGKNNMLLTANLLIAQLLFLFGSGKYELEYGCKIIGLFLHLFWLVSLFMMNSSTIHMVRVFAVFENPKHFEAQSNSVLIKYAIYSFTVSGILVLVNIVTNLVKSGGKNIGYGGCICYISTKLMIGITFALPVGCIVLSNIILFIVVMISINKLSNFRHSSGNHRNFFVIYFKLSCLTGITWVFGFMNEVIQSVVLSYLFVVFNAGQGIYIMLAFMCNKRVLRLLCPSDNKHAKVNRQFRSTGENGSSETKQTLSSSSSHSTFVESRMSRCYDDFQPDLKQCENTRL